MVQHYLKAIEVAGTDEATAVARRMKAIPVNDFYAKWPVLLCKGGRLMNDLMLYEVKSPAEPHRECDLYKPLSRFRQPMCICLWRTASARYYRRCRNISCHRPQLVRQAATLACSLHIHFGSIRSNGSRRC